MILTRRIVNDFWAFGELVLRRFASPMSEESEEHSAAYHALCKKVAQVTKIISFLVARNEDVEHEKQWLDLGNALAFSSARLVHGFVRTAACVPWTR